MYAHMIVEIRKKLRRTLEKKIERKMKVDFEELKF
jgi:hypothetical protein